MTKESLSARRTATTLFLKSSGAIFIALITAIRTFDFYTVVAGKRGRQTGVIRVTRDSNFHSFERGSRRSVKDVF